MRRRTIAIIIAVVLALAAAGLVVWYVSSIREETTTAEQTQTVLVATADIPERTTGEAMIENGLVERQQVAISSVTPGALTSELSLQGKVLDHSRGQRPATAAESVGCSRGAKPLLPDQAGHAGDHVARGSPHRGRGCDQGG